MGLPSVAAFPSVAMAGAAKLNSPLYTHKLRALAEPRETRRRRWTIG